MTPVERGVQLRGAIARIPALIAWRGLPGAAPCRWRLGAQPTHGFTAPRRLLPLEPEALALVGLGTQRRMGSRTDPGVQTVDRKPGRGGGCQRLPHRGTHPPLRGLGTYRHRLDGRLGCGGQPHGAYGSDLRRGRARGRRHHLGVESGGRCHRAGPPRLVSHGHHPTGHARGVKGRTAPVRADGGVPWAAPLPPRLA